MVLTHQRHSGIMGLFKKKINYGLICRFSKTEFKIVVDSVSGEPFIEMSQEDADKWDKEQMERHD